MAHPLAQYAYEITKDQMRSTPIEPRDASRLFVYDTKTDIITFDYFYNIARYLPERALLVLNNTGVIPARVNFTKDTGGIIEGLMLFNEGFDADGAVPVIVGKRLYPGRKISLGGYWFLITRQDEQKFYIKPEFDAGLIPDLLLKHGTTPTPYYLGKSLLPEQELRARYQTIFAKSKKSVAAPTASLHFTPRVFESLVQKGVTNTEITLDVGLGTFQEVEEKNVAEKFLHEEKFFLTKESLHELSRANQEKLPVVAVGTTSVRALESNAAHILEDKNEDLVGGTNIFIMPPYDFKIVDHLITNFHVPESSLMALVDAFLEHKKAKRRILELYDVALKEGFKFYSFGDSMLIL